MTRPVDLDSIRASLAACSDIPWTCQCVDPATLAALVEEVERLRGQRGRIVSYLELMAEEGGDPWMSYIAEEVRDGRDGG